MLIEFKIQLDDSGTPKVTQAEAAINPNLPAQKQLSESFPGAATLKPAVQSKKGGSAPVGDPGTGSPGGVASGSGMVFVIGPIVICGSGAADKAGGSAPVGDPGTGGPHKKAAE
jgi:hypothetical protein